MIQILISTMFLKSAEALLEKMNIQSDAVIVDQCDVSCEQQLDYKGFKIKIVHTTERGLSKSRNMAIKNATAEIIVFCDDDFRYVDGYADVVERAYNEFKNADMIVFGAIRADDYVYRQIPDGKMSPKYKYSINSIRISARRSAVIDKKVEFDEMFGTGAEVKCGEDTIFVNDCFKSKMAIFSKNTVICKGFNDNRKSTWWQGYDEEFFVNKGKVYKRMSPHCFAFILYFTTKHYKEYKKKVSFLNAIKLMVKGTNSFKPAIISKE